MKALPRLDARQQFWRWLPGITTRPFPKNSTPTEPVCILQRTIRRKPSMCVCSKNWKHKQKHQQHAPGAKLSHEKTSTDPCQKSVQALRLASAKDRTQRSIIIRSCLRGPGEQQNHDPRSFIVNRCSMKTALGALFELFDLQEGWPWNQPKN